MNISQGEIHYKPYIGYHLWLHFEQTRIVSLVPSTSVNNGSEIQSEYSNKAERSLYEEMRRVANTVLLAMRSERDIMAALRMQA
jgi:hypothetical protein